MKKIIFVLSASLLLSSCIYSKRVTDLPIPIASIPEEQLDIAAYEKKYGKYSGVYLELEYIIEHTGNQMGLAIDPWTFYKVSKIKYMVFNPDDESLATFNLKTHASANLSKVYLRIIYPNGEVKQFGKDDLYSEKSSKYEVTYKFAYPSLKKGTVIEEGYELVYKVPTVYPPLDHDYYLQYSIPCEKLKISYAFPDWWSIQSKEIAENVSIDVAWINDLENHKKIATYSAKDIPAYMEEPYAPFFKEVGKYFQFQITNLSMGQIHYNAPSSWHKAVRNLKKYATYKDRFFSFKVRDMTNELIAGINNPMDRLDAVLTYIQEDIEISRDKKKRNFKNILNDKKGDVYRITGLAQSMLLKAGIDAKYLLLHSAEDGYFDKSYFSADQFTMPAIGVIVDHQTYVVFPYIKIPIGFVPERFQGQPAIAISFSDDSNYRVDFWDVPAGTDTQNRVEELYKLFINDEGFIQVKEEKTFFGYLSYRIRERLKELKEDEQKDFVENLLTYEEGMVELISYEIQNLESFKEPLTVELEYGIDNLVTVLPDEVIFQTGGLFSPASGATYKIDTDRRHNPIKILYDEKFSKQITIAYPNSWAIVTTLENINFENLFGSIVGHYEMKRGELRVFQNRKLIKCYEPKEKISDLIEITGNRSKLAIPTIVFRITDEQL